MFGPGAAGGARWPCPRPAACWWAWSGRRGCWGRWSRPRGPAARGAGCTWPAPGPSRSPGSCCRSSHSAARSGPSGRGPSSSVFVPSPQPHWQCPGTFDDIHRWVREESAEEQQETHSFHRTLAATLSRCHYPKLWTENISRRDQRMFRTETWPQTLFAVLEIISDIIVLKLLPVYLSCTHR